jgi:hypothetical protein
LQGEFDVTVEFLKQAIVILERLPAEAGIIWTARYWHWLAIAQIELGEIGEARFAYEQAITAGTDRLDGAEIKVWQEELDQLENDI